VEQCDGLSLEALTAPAHPAETGTVADEVARLAGAKVVRGGDRAFFSPSADVVNVPVLAAFRTPAEYDATLLHELTHWTGHEKRLARTFGKRFGDSAYAFEELVAELGAAFLCARLGVVGQLQHAEYLGHWAKVLKADKHAIFTAAREAEKACGLLLPVEEEGEEDADAACARRGEGFTPRRTRWRRRRRREPARPASARSRSRATGRWGATGGASRAGAGSASTTAPGTPARASVRAGSPSRSRPRGRPRT
jgi:hypothetical protein